jgi:hypothetical protein
LSPLSALPRRRLHMFWVSSHHIDLLPYFFK